MYVKWQHNMGQQGALQVILTYVNKLASIEGINDAFWIATACLSIRFKFILKR